MRLYRTSQGLARLEGDELAVLDLPHADLAALFADSAVRLGSARVRSRIALADAVVLAPVIQPATIVIAGFNYKSHIAEMGGLAPTKPPLAALAAGPGVTAAWNADIVLPRAAPGMVDYEGELGIVIGRTARNISAADALRHVGGLTVLNDVSARDVQHRAMQERDPALGLGKLFPSFKPCGPAVLTPDELELDSLDFELETRVNGERRQHGSTRDFLFSVAELIEAATRQATLQPGDLICTGTPGGVGAATGVFLKPGDVIEVRIAGIGALRNEVVVDA